MTGDFEIDDFFDRHGDAIDVSLSISAVFEQAEKMKHEHRAMLPFIDSVMMIDPPPRNIDQATVDPLMERFKRIVHGVNIKLRA
jgi:hypothetical protein